MTTDPITGRFWVVPVGLWSVENNINVANMGLADSRGQ